MRTKLKVKMIVKSFFRNCKIKMIILVIGGQPGC